jgi:putative drug exporter of the RND superfamily
VIPATGPLDTATEDLVRTLREDVIPAVAGSAADDVHVGRATASAIDSTSNIAERIPLLIAGVVAVSMQACHPLCSGGWPSRCRPDR